MKQLDKKVRAEIVYWGGFIILVLILAMWLGVLPGFELPNLFNSVWWGTSKDLVDNQGWFDFSCNNVAYPVEVQLNEAFSICFFTRLFLTMGISEVFSLSLCFFVVYLFGAISLIFALRIICKNKLCQYFGFILYYLVPILQANTSIVQTYFGYLLIPVCLLADCCLVIYVRNENKTIIKTILLLAAHFFGKLLLVSTGWYLSVIYAVVSCLVLQILILFNVKKNNMKKVFNYELWFIGVGLVTWFITMLLIKQLVPAGTEDFSYTMERFNGSSVDLLTCFIPSITQKLSDYVNVSDFIPDNMVLTGDSTFYSNYLGLALIICNFYGVICKKYRNRYNVTLLIVAGIIFILSLGPALKFCKFIEGNAVVYSVDMEGQIVFPWKFLWYIFPISDMRTVFRWIFGSYVCLVINAVYILSEMLEKKGNKIFIACIICLAVIEYFPNNTYDSIIKKFDNYQMAVQQKSAICDEIQPFVEENSIAVISNMGGYSNHYLCVPIAAGLNIRIYNVSGDKNSAILQGLPEEIAGVINTGELDALIQHTITVLEEDEAEYVIFPAFDLRMGAMSWPYDSAVMEVRNANMDYIEEYLNNRYHCIRTEHYLIISK